MRDARSNALKSMTVAGVCAALCLVGFNGRTAATTKSDTYMNGLIHRWQFDGNCNDSVGLLSTNPIGPVIYTEVDRGQGIVFDGSSTGINLPLTRDMQFEGSFSISVWAKLEAKPSGSQMWSSIIFNGDDRAGLDPYALQVDPQGKMHFLLTGANGEGITVEAPTQINAYVYYTATYDKAAGVQRLYINGKLVGQNEGYKNLTPVCSLVEHENAGIGIGTNNGFPNSHFHFHWKGVISDLRIYNRALSSEESLGIYHQGVVASRPARIKTGIPPP